MGLMYSKYTSPLEFMNLYIEQGRFGEFVAEIIDAEYKRRQEEREKEEDRKLWDMYIHSMAEKSFNDWKEEVLKAPSNTRKCHDEDMTDSDILAIIDHTFSMK